MRPILVLFILGAFQVLVPPIAPGQVEAAAVVQVRSAAGARLLEFLNRIPAGQEAAYGFRSRNEFLEAGVGEPYQMFTLESRDDASGCNYAWKPLNEWRVPVRVRGECRALLTVTRTDDQWRTVDFGASVLARELDECEQRHARSPRAMHRGILRIFESSCDFLLMYDQSASADETNVIPLESARRALETIGLSVIDEQSMRECLPLLGKLTEPSGPHRK